MNNLGFSSEAFKKDFSFEVPYSTQCALALVREAAKHSIQMKAFLRSKAKTMTLSDLNELIAGLPFVFVAGQDASNPRFPQTIDNLKKWKDRSGLGLIYAAAVPQAVTINAERLPAVFVRTKHRENLVMHESAKGRLESPELVAKYVSPERERWIVIETRKNFSNLFIQMMQGICSDWVIGG